jgi:hypothetical protein
MNKERESMKSKKNRILPRERWRDSQLVVKGALRTIAV